MPIFCDDSAVAKSHDSKDIKKKLSFETIWKSRSIFDYREHKMIVARFKTLDLVTIE